MAVLCLHKNRFPKTMFIELSMVGFAPSGSYQSPLVLKRLFRMSYGCFRFARKIDFPRPCLLNSPRSVLPLRVHIEAHWSWNAYFGRVRALSNWFQNSLCWYSMVTRKLLLRTMNFEAHFADCSWWSAKLCFQPCILNIILLSFHGDVHVFA